MVVAGEIESDDRVAELLRWEVLAATRGYQKSEVAQHFRKGIRAPVVPRDDSLGCVAPANEPELDGVPIGCAALARDLGKQPAFGHRDGGVVSGSRVQHRQTLLEGRAGKIFVGKYTRQNEHDFVAVFTSGAGQREVGDGDWIEAAGEDSEALWIACRPVKELHKKLILTGGIEGGNRAKFRNQIPAFAGRKGEFCRTQKCEGRGTNPAPFLFAGETLGSHQFVHRFARVGLEFVAIGSFLAADAVFGPRHRVQALGLDLVFAMEADSVAPIGDTA